MPKSTNLVGKNFGHLTVLGIGKPYISDSGYKRKRWHCQCDCGKTTEVDTHSLLTGNTTSCGHVLPAQMIKRTHTELVGQTFGHLTVLEDDGTRHSRQVKWLCQCDCGKKIHVTTRNLKSRNTRSCGHVGTERIKKYIEREKILHPKTRISELGTKPNKNNKTGERNISLVTKGNKIYYRVAVMYQRHQYGGLYETMEEAIEQRDILRKTYWPNFKDK